MITATDLGRLLVTHNGKDYRNLCEAWRVWRRVWGLPPADHAGVIAIPQSISLAESEAIRQIDHLLENQQPLWNTLWYFDTRVGDWIRQV